MTWMLAAVILCSALTEGLCFNIDPRPWRSWSQNAAGFGYQVVQRQSDVLISAPLEQYAPNRRGQIYKCSDAYCQIIMPSSVPEFAVNMSLGLTMTADPDSQNTMACGPTIPKDCISITMYNGVCYQIDGSGKFTSMMPSTPPECRVDADIAFLLDGSGSVLIPDFERMKQFVKQMVGQFIGQNTQFAIVQFSNYVNEHYNFRNFFNTGSWERNIDNIQQLYGGTGTGGAIQYMVDNIFKPSAGARPNVKQILIVITDGESTDSGKLPRAVANAENKKIVRFAIGVGSAFSKADAIKELNLIASSPRANYVFQVQNFGALDKIKKNLQERIFSIEGSSGEKLKMEMAQAGLSAAYIPAGIQMGIVGANQWKGGYMTYRIDGMEVGSNKPSSIDADSYLGYSMAVARTRQGTLTVVGAPRYKHRGLVMVFRRNSNHQIDPCPWQCQTGEYFGAEVRAMDVNGDRYTDLILISAPLYKESNREGRVYVCGLSSSTVDCHLDSPLVLRGDMSDQARFGYSLAVLPDINADRLNEVVVGAPLENDGKGSIYIFHGEGGYGINPIYAQRIAASEVSSSLNFFGLSISERSYDHSGDRLTDLAVGSKGTVVLLRSMPVVMVEATVSFTLNLIPTKNPDCTTTLANTAELCFSMTKLSALNTARAKINYTFTLDATRKVPNNRAYIRDKQREITSSFETGLQQKCFQVPFFIEACPEDALNALTNELSFTFDGIPSRENLKPSLAQQAKTTTFHSLGFEINCGTDDKCVDNLKVDFNFTSSTELKVGIDELLDVTVSVQNTEEDSYNSFVKLTYPAELSYRKFTSLEGQIECNSLDSEDGLSRGLTQCTINKPILKSNSEALFIVSYGIEDKRPFDRRIFITANATSDNLEHSTSSELNQMKWMDVKYSILVTFESSLSYSNFTFGKNDEQKPLQPSIVVTNNIRALNFTVVLKVPVKLGDKDIWADSSLQIPDCQRDADQDPKVTDFVAMIQKTYVVDCDVAKCAVFHCSRFMARLERRKYTISANVSSGWIEQIGLDSGKFLLVSTASLEYDSNQYIFFSTGSNNMPPIHKIEAEIEVYSKQDFTKEIVGGSLGGLVLLALLTAGLYKAGFFKSKYKDLMNEAEGDNGPGDDGDAVAEEQT